MYNDGLAIPANPNQSRFDDFEWLHHSIAYSYVQVKSHEYAAIKTSFDRKPRATIRGSF